MVPSQRALAAMAAPKALDPRGSWEDLTLASHQLIVDAILGQLKESLRLP